MVPLDARIQRINETRKSSAPYLDKRCDQCNGKIVKECLELQYQKDSGEMARYKLADLRYDIKAERLRVVTAPLGGAVKQKVGKVVRKGVRKSVTAKALSAKASLPPDSMIYSVIDAMRQTPSSYLTKRCDQCNGKSVRECLKLRYKRLNGDMDSYKLGDLRYDIKAGRLRVVAAPPNRSSKPNPGKMTSENAVATPERRIDRTRQAKSSIKSQRLSAASASADKTVQPKLKNKTRKLAKANSVSSDDSISLDAMVQRIKETCQSPPSYMDKRCDECNGKSVRECLELQYRKQDGEMAPYRRGDLRYDIKAKRIRLVTEPSCSASTNLPKKRKVGEMLWKSARRKLAKASSVFSEECINLDAMVQRIKETCQSPPSYMDKRCDECNEKSVRECLELRYRKQKGKMAHYTLGDLRYDIKAKRLRLVTEPSRSASTSTPKKRKVGEMLRKSARRKLAKASSVSSDDSISLDAMVQRIKETCQSPPSYMDKRCDQCNGKSVRECLELQYRNQNGEMAHYRRGDLRYDIRAKRLRLVAEPFRSEAAKLRKTIGENASKKVISSTTTKASASKASSASETVETRSGKARVAAVSTSASPMDMSRFFAFCQCSLKMEAQHFMNVDVTLTDPLAISMWPDVHKMCSRNLGKNEKWVPFHTVLGVHENYVVKEIHHAQVEEWTEYRRFVLTFIFRAHCKRELFELQAPLMKSAQFWQDPCHAFQPGSPMEKEIRAFRRKGNALQTGCFLIIPERLLKDDDENLIRNLLFRTQRLIKLSDELWPIVQDANMPPMQRFMTIRNKTLAVRGLGDTWVKMLTVVVDIAQPRMRLLQDQCEVGVGSSDPLRKILEQEGLLEARERCEHSECCGKSEPFAVCVDLKAGVVKVMCRKNSLLQVTCGKAGSLDRAHAVAEELCKLANRGCSIDQLKPKKLELLDDQSLNVPILGLDAKRKAALEAEAGVEKGDGKRSATISALTQLRDCIATSTILNAVFFREVLEEVETKMRAHFKDYTLIVEQMKTQERGLSCATVQVQLCEFRQFENFVAAAK